MGPERKLYQKLRKSIPQISWIRLENNSLHGTPDLLGYNNSGHFFTVELKVTKSKVEHLGSGAVKLFPGSGVLALEACGLKLEPLCLSLDACRLFLQELGA
jgi:hypothetical protein